MQEEESNLVKARSSIVWILALLLAFGAVWWIEKESGRELIAKSQPRAGAAADASIDFTSSALVLPAPRALTEQEQAWARTAWQFFGRNTDRDTGLAYSVAGFPSGSLWDEGSYLLALVAAHRLGVVTPQEFDARMSKALASLGALPLTSVGLPNKAYDLQKLAMTDYRNQPAPRGVGVSAIDVARVAIALETIAWRHPQHTAAARAVAAKWNLESLAHSGRLAGWSATGSGLQRVQEGRTGYEQYAATALAAWHLDVADALRWTSNLKWVGIGGDKVPADTRDGAIDAVVSEPYVLHGLELGWSPIAREMAWRVYSAQEARFQSTGVMTAVSEDHLDRAPYFAYNAVHAAGHEWTAVSMEGKELPSLRTLSVKAAFAWHALLRTPYTQKLVEKVAALHEPANGWYAGLYEEDGQPNRSINCNTNAVVLESLAYISGGPLGGIK